MKLYFNSIIYLIIMFLLPEGICTAQFYNNGSQVTVTNGTQLSIKSSDLVNNDSSIYNAGTITVEGDCFISNKPTSRIVTFGTDSLIVYNNFTDGSLYGQNSGVLSLKGTYQTIVSTSSLLANLHIMGAGTKTISGSAFVRFKLDLQKGHISVTSPSVFGIDSTGSLVQSVPGTNSFVIGALYRKKINGIDSLFYPIGNLISEYRPATLVGISNPFAGNPTFGIATNISAPTAGSGISTIYKRIWTVKSNKPSYPVNNIRLTYLPADVAATPLQNLVVGQSASPTGKYASIGNISVQAGSVLSEFKPSQDFYAIGSTNNVKGNFRVLLEGPFNGSDMDTKLFSNSALTDSLLPSIGMLPGYNIPANAVDRIAFVLKSSGTYIDTAYSWVLKDGSIKDYATGTKDYVTFSKAIPGNSYYVIADHRNHLPGSSDNIKLTNTSTNGVYNHDYSNGVFGGGARFDLASGKWLLYASDSYKSFKNQTDVMDVGSVGRDEIQFVTGNNHYRRTDVNLDGRIDAKDFQLSTDHNSKLYYSTLP